MTINYDYILDWIADNRRQSGLASPRILDFGCGAGQIVKAGLERGLDIWGADTFQAVETWEADLVHGAQAGSHERMLTEAGATATDHIVRIEGERLPFPENHFDIVVANQVFEHVRDLDRPLREIRRVLRPGGVFLALFPGKETWWEGHCQIYFAHWLKPPMQELYLRVAKKCGFGRIYGSDDPRQWAADFVAYLRDYCFYRPSRVIDRAWRETFDADPTDVNSSYMLYRLSRSRVAAMGKWFDNAIGRHLLSFICTARAGRVITVTNAK